MAEKMVFFFQICLSQRDWKNPKVSVWNFKGKLLIMRRSRVIDMMPEKFHTLTEGFFQSQCERQNWMDHTFLHLLSLYSLFEWGVLLYIAPDIGRLILFYESGMEKWDGKVSYLVRAGWKSGIERNLYNPEKRRNSQNMQKNHFLDCVGDYYM